MVYAVYFDENYGCLEAGVEFYCDIFWVVLCLDGTATLRYSSCPSTTVDIFEAVVDPKDAEEIINKYINIHIESPFETYDRKDEAREIAEKIVKEIEERGGVFELVEVCDLLPDGECYNVAEEEPPYSGGCGS